MSSGQIFLTLGAIVLLMVTVINVNRSYLTSVNEGVRIQQSLDAINYGQALSELMYSQAPNYSNLDAQFGNLNDVSNPAQRLSYVTPTGETLYATIELSAEQELAHNQTGRLATITVYEEVENDFQQRARFFAAISQI